VRQALSGGLIRRDYSGFHHPRAPDKDAGQADGDMEWRQHHQWHTNASLDCDALLPLFSEQQNSILLLELQRKHNILIA
jgi:hypothetical protein